MLCIPSHPIPRSIPGWDDGMSCPVSYKYLNNKTKCVNYANVRLGPIRRSHLSVGPIPSHPRSVPGWDHGIWVILMGTRLSCPVLFRIDMKMIRQKCVSYANVGHHHGWDVVVLRSFNLNIENVHTIYKGRIN